ncbi:MAG: hypothetical protein LQ341_005329, partial [Variospora aurantia]
YNIMNGYPGFIVLVISMVSERANTLCKLYFLCFAGDCLWKVCQSKFGKSDHIIWHVCCSHVL